VLHSEQLINSQSCVCGIQYLPNHLPLIVQHQGLKTSHLCLCLILEKSTIKQKKGFRSNNFQFCELFMYLFSLTEGTVKFVLYLRVSILKCSALGSQSERGSCLIDYLIIHLWYASVDIGSVLSRNGPYLWRDAFEHKYLPKVTMVSVEAYENTITRYLPYIHWLKEP